MKIDMQDHGAIEVKDQQAISDFVPFIFKRHLPGINDGAWSALTTDDHQDPVGQNRNFSNWKIENDPKHLNYGPADIGQYPKSAVL